MKRANLIALAVLGLSLLQMIGYATGLRPLRGIAAATTASPCPLVFSDVDGIETFASSFELTYLTSNGKPASLAITPEIYAQVRGPYNRRNVYGAALSYGPTPRFPKDLFDAVFTYALEDPGTLASDIGLPDGAHDFRLHVRTHTEGRFDHWILPSQ